MENLDDFLSKGKEWFDRLIETIREYAKKLKESEKWFSTTLSSIGDAVIANDKLGNVQFLNPVAESLTGWKQEESVGKPLEDIFNIINEDTRKTVENPVSRVIREGVIIGLANHTVLITKSGKEIPIADSGAPIKDDEGNIIGVVLIFRDITELRKAEQELIESEEKYRNLSNETEMILDHIPGNVFYKDAKNNFIRVNKLIADAYNMTKEELIGKNLFDLYPKEVAQAYWDDDLEVIKSGKPKLNFEEPWDTKEGRRWVSTSKIPNFDSEGKITGIIGFSKDITERRKAELKIKESEKEYREAYNRAEFYKDLFTHDINNILQGILSGIELSGMHIGDSEKLKEVNSMIKDQVMRGAKLVSNIRKLSKLEETEISIKQIEICSILEKSITYVKNSYPDRNITIQIDSISKKLYVKANELLEDVFENILINAVKYNENPIVEIIVKISKEEWESLSYLKMEFLDNGIGIDDLRKKLIFQREYTEETSVLGMGLGLSLVKKIIEAYNGKIWVEDRVKGDHSKGSNFFLILPEV